MEKTVKVTLGVGASLLVLVAAVLHAAIFGVVFDAAYSKVNTNPCVCLPGAKVEPSRVGSPVVTAPVMTGGTVNVAAHDELKQQCLPCQQNRRLPVYVQPTYVQPAYVQPAYVQPAYVQPTVQPARPAVPVAPVLVNPAPAPKPAPLAPLVKPEPRYSIALFVDSSPRSQTLLRWFSANRDLAGLRANCAYQVYTSDSSVYRTRFANIVPIGAFPAMLFMQPDGGVIHKVSGAGNMPSTDVQLVADLKQSYSMLVSVKNAEARNSMRGSGVSWDANPGLSGSNRPCPDGTCPDGSCVGPDGTCPVDGNRPLWRPFLKQPEPEQSGFLRNFFLSGVESLALVAVIVVLAGFAFLVGVAVVVKLFLNRS